MSNRKTFIQNPDGSTSVGVKDDSGAYVPAYGTPPPPKPPELVIGTSIDDMLGGGLQAIRAALYTTAKQVYSGTFDRETIMNLKDILAMLHELKKKEAELLDNMSEAELQELLKK